MKTITDESVVEDENSDIIQMWEPLELEINEEYKYVPTGMLFTILSNILYYIIAFPILRIITKLVYDLKIEGKENIRNLKNGAVTVSNHVLFLDCAMVGLACGLKKVYYTTREGSFKIPFVRKLIKLLRAIPIPKNIKNKKNFIKEINNLLQTGKVVHFYPEAALWTYYEKLRNFKDGAFEFAVNNKVPVVPMVFKFREPQGIRKIFKKKKDVTLVVLEPITNTEGENKRNSVENLKQKVHKQMENELK